jgi:hypothetical protein
LTKKPPDGLQEKTMHETRKVYEWIHHNEKTMFRKAFVGAIWLKDSNVHAINEKIQKSLLAIIASVEH